MTPEALFDLVVAELGPKHPDLMATYWRRLHAAHPGLKVRMQAVKDNDEAAERAFRWLQHETWRKANHLWTKDEADARKRQAFEMRLAGASFDEIGAELDVRPQRAREIVHTAAERIGDARDIYRIRCKEELALDLWHTFTPDSCDADGFDEYYNLDAVRYLHACAELFAVIA